MGRSLPVANALRRPNRQVRPAPHGLKGRSATKKSADRGRRPRFCGRLPSYGTFSTDWGAPLGAPFYICGKERKKSLDGRGVMCYNKSRRKMRGCSSMVEPQPSKLTTGVRFSSSAPVTFLFELLCLNLTYNQSKRIDFFMFQTPIKFRNT